MKILLDIDEKVIQSSAQQIIKRLFEPPPYRNSDESEGWKLLREQVKMIIEETDFRSSIKKTTIELVESITRDVLGDIIRRHIKEQAGAMKKDGTLFEDIK